MQRKSEVSDALVMFMEDVGIPRKLIFEGSQEQNGPNSKFMRTVKKSNDVVKHQAILPMAKQSGTRSQGG